MSSGITSLINAGVGAAAKSTAKAGIDKLIEGAEGEAKKPVDTEEDEKEKKTLMQAANEYFGVQKFYLQKVAWLLGVVVFRSGAHV